MSYAPRATAICGLVFGVTVASGVACQSASPPTPPSGGFVVESSCPDDLGYSLKAGMVSDSPVRDRGVRMAYGTFLKSAGEKPLWCGPGPAIAYRVLWVPAFRPAVLASIVEASGEWNAAVARFVDPREPDGMMNGYGSRLASSRDAQPVSPAVVRGLMAAEEAAEFWTAPAWDTAGADDGWLLVIEVRRGTSYRIMARHDPLPTPANAAVLHLGRSLLEAAGEPLPERMQLTKRGQE